jgi:hypothetical protein
VRRQEEAEADAQAEAEAEAEDMRDLRESLESSYEEAGREGRKRVAVEAY